ADGRIRIVAPKLNSEMCGRIVGDANTTYASIRDFGRQPAVDLTVNTDSSEGIDFHQIGILILSACPTQRVRGLFGRVRCVRVLSESCRAKAQRRTQNRRTDRLNL